MLGSVVTKQEQEQFKQEQEGPLTQEDEFLYKNFINTLKAKNTKSDYTRYVITNIIRIKRGEGNEYLYSMSQLQGFDSLGSPISRSISKPEVWTKTEFGHQRRYDEKTDTLIEESKGPIGSSEVYEMPFSPENVDRLYKQGLGVNGNKLLEGSNNNRSVQFYVKDERTGIDIKIAKHGHN